MACFARVVLALVIAQGTECGERAGTWYKIGGSGQRAAVAAAGSALPAFVPASVTVFREPIFHRAATLLRAREEEARSEAAGKDAAAKIVPAHRDGDAAPVHASRMLADIGKGSLMRLPLWNALRSTADTIAKWLQPRPESESPRCGVCANTQTAPCPNCDALGFYVAYNRRIQCTCCHGRGRVMCRACFRGDPWDIEAVRERMRGIPD